MAFLSQVRNNKKTAILALMDETSKKGKVNKKPDSKLFYVYRSVQLFSDPGVFCVFCLMLNAEAQLNTKTYIRAIVFYQYLHLYLHYIYIFTIGICRPNTGQQVKQETLGELKKKYKKVT